MIDLPVTHEEDEAFEEIERQQLSNSINNNRAANDFKSHLVRESINITGVQSLINDNWQDGITEESQT